MKKLNQSGVTTVEILICFVIVVAITVSMYATVSSYNQKRILEGYKEKITSYKNILTKDIQDDFIKIGLSGITHKREVDGIKVINTVDASLKDGTKRQLVIEQIIGKSSYHPTGTPNTNDYFMIKYGDPEDLIEYELPNLGSYKEDDGSVIQDLSINNVLIQILDEKVLSIYVGFYHPELGTRYALNIVAPINFVFTGAEFISDNKINYFISYNLKGGTIVGEKNPIMYDKRTEKITLHNPVKAGYTFLGWTGSNGSDYSMEVTIPKGSMGNRKYTANWRPNECKITYVPNNGTFKKHTNSLSQTCYYQDNMEFRNMLCNVRTALGDTSYYQAERKGYSITNDSTWVIPGRSVIPAGQNKLNILCPELEAKDQEVVLSTNWKINTYTITYNFDITGVTNNNPTTYTVESNNIVLNRPNRVGYEFKGWIVNDGDTPNPDVSIPKGSTGNKKYKGVFRAYTCTIEYSPNGGRFQGSANTTQTCAYKDSGNCMDNMRDAKGGTYDAVLRGYHPKNTQEWIRDGDGVVFNQASGYRAIDFCPNLRNGDQRVTLKVNWEIDSYQLTYDMKGYGSCNPTSKNAYYNTAWGPLCTPRSDDAEFLGWYKNSDLSGSQFTANDIALGDTTIYAKWQEIQKVWTYSYTKTIQTFPVPRTGRYLLQVWGAHGGTCDINGGEFGGYAEGTIRLQKDKTLYVVVGGFGGKFAGGYNGGGNGAWGGGNSEPAGGPQWAYGGGGATHIATASGLLSSLSNNRAAVLIVAGGGGGSGGGYGPYPGTEYARCTDSPGGHGGGDNGNNGKEQTNSISFLGHGGTQSGGGESGQYGAAYGSFGQGASAEGQEWGGAGGGGGWYGGGSSNRGHAGGGGGSGHIGNGFISKRMIVGNRNSPVFNTGHGYVIITYVGA